MKEPLKGVYAPVLTPFESGSGRPHQDLFVQHCRWLTAQGAGLAIFGTNSEAASLSVAERTDLLDALIAAGIPASRLMPGTGACSITDAVELTAHALGHGVTGVLAIPPFFFKGVGDDGLFAYYAELIERIGDDHLSIYLYHIPQLSHAPITIGLIERLLKRYPHSIGGAKDSSGDWDNTKAMLEAFGADGFAVFPASESLLSRAMPLAAAGCISATVNVNPSGIKALYDGWLGPNGAKLQATADRIRETFQSTAMIPAMKAVLAHASGETSWRGVRPPLLRLSEQAEDDLFARLSAVGFALPDYPCVAKEAV